MGVGTGRLYGKRVRSRTEQAGRVPGHGRAADSVGGDQSASGLTAGAEAL